LIGGTINAMEDKRNVMDEFKGKAHDDIVMALDDQATGLEIAIENTLRDFNMGTIVRTANAFGVRTIHVIGRRQWNKRGAMATDKYLDIIYHDSPGAFVSAVMGKSIVAVDNVPGSKPLNTVVLPKNSILVFGQEGPGISDDLLKHANQVVAIEQFGSTRSLNVGVAAGIAMYEFIRRTYL
jgi:tRNA G18 (ribose-2'-O)-methylase SpoU